MQSDCSDRFIPQRVDHNNEAIYQLSSANGHEIELINKFVKMNKKKQDEEPEAARLPERIRQENHNAVGRGQAQQTLNRRGLFTVDYDQEQNDVEMPSEQDEEASFEAGSP